MPILEPFTRPPEWQEVVLTPSLSLSNNNNCSHFPIKTSPTREFCQYINVLFNVVSKNTVV